MNKTWVIDLDRCTGCQTCMVSCKFENGLGLGVNRTDVIEVGPTGIWPDIEMYWMPYRCQQCSDAPCVEVCPTGASKRADDGVVTIDQSLCIGCKSCLKACPYSDDEGAIRPSVRWFNKTSGLVTKCTMCEHYTAESDGVENGEDTFDAAHAVPPCVHNCPNKALHFGDLDNEASDAAQQLAAAKAAGRGVYQLDSNGEKPTAYYLLSESVAAWQGAGSNFVLKAND